MTDQPSDLTTPETLPPLLLVPADRVAWMLSIHKRTVRVLDVTEQIPAPVRIGRRTLWRVADIESWVAAGCPARHRWEADRAREAEREAKQRARHT